MSEILPLTAVIGFGGNVPNGLIVHPDGDTVIYSLGSTVVLRSKKDAGNQQFLRGHSHEVCILNTFCLPQTSTVAWRFQMPKYK